MSYREEMNKIYVNDGLRGFTRGYSGMFFRDAPGFGLYFCLFEAFKNLLGVNPSQSNFAQLQYNNLNGD